MLRVRDTSRSGKGKRCLTPKDAAPRDRERRTYDRFSFAVTRRSKPTRTVGFFHRQTERTLALATNPQQHLNELICGYWHSQCVYVAAKLGIADLVADGPRSVEDLAKTTGTHAPSLHRLLRRLASLGVFTEKPERHYALTPAADLLRADVPGSQRAMAIMMGEEHFRAWGELLYSVRTGKPAFDKIFGQPVFDYLSKSPEQAAIFDKAMVGVHGRETAAIAEAYDFSTFGSITDIGGGNGSTLTGILKQNPTLRGTLFDLPGVIERARQNLETGLSNRIQLTAGNFFESVPSGDDAYFMRHIIHDWDDEKAAQNPGQHPQGD